MLPDRLAAAGIKGPMVRQLQQQGELEVGDDGGHRRRRVRLEDVSEPRPGQSVAVVMDTRPCPGADGLARGVDLLVCESTYQKDAVLEAHERFHMTAGGAADLATRNGARRLALTHFSQRYATLEGFQAEASELHSDVFIADDLARVEVPARRCGGGE
jgi:ribonuclease Z